MTKITIKSGSWDKGIADLNKYIDSLSKKAEKLIKILSEIGQGRAEFGFQTAYYPQNTNDVTVTVEELEPLHYKVVAQGRAVLFIEFGAGDDASHPLGQELGYVSDAWSVEHKQAYHRFGQWTWNGVTLSGIPATRSMYEASKDIRLQIESTARRIFNDRY